MVENGLRNSGIDVIGHVPWGTHFCQFYRTKHDLIDILVPYFKAGLDNNEFCMWVTAEPLVTAEAKNAMTGAVPDLSKYLASGQIEIIDYHEWYLPDGTFNDDRVLSAWVDKLNEALLKGYSGLRLTGNTFWLERNHWQAFTEYEAKVNNVIGQYHMLAICTYCLDKCDGAAVVDVVKNHQFAIIKQEGKWDLIESTIYKQARAALKESEKKYRNLFDTMSEGFAVHEIILDDSGSPVDYRFLEVNEAFCRQTGLSADSVLGKTVKEVLPSIEPFWIETYGQVVKTGKPAAFENFSSSLNKWYEVNAYYVDKGRFATLFRDITERKQTEKLKDEFIGMVSHELKTPLTIIVGALTVAGKDGVTSKQSRELINDAVTNASTLAGIVDNLLELSRYQANHLALNMEPKDIGQIIHSVTEKLRSKSILHRITTEIPPDLPPVVIDQIRVERILHNLIDNAIKYSPSGGEIKVFVKQEDNKLLLGVSDHGIGISPEDRHRLFQSFERLGGHYTHSIRGIGLGLKVCRILVEAHGGQIWLDSQPGKGSTFYFTLSTPKGIE